MVHPRVSDTQPIANMLEVVLRDPSSELAKVRCVQPRSLYACPPGAVAPTPSPRLGSTRQAALEASKEPREASGSWRQQGLWLRSSPLHSPASTGG